MWVYYLWSTYISHQWRNALHNPVRFIFCLCGPLETLFKPTFYIINLSSPVFLLSHTNPLPDLREPVNGKYQLWLKVVENERECSQQMKILHYYCHSVRFSILWPRTNARFSCRTSASTYFSESFACMEYEKKEVTGGGVGKRSKSTICIRHVRKAM